ncbi:30S ribosomal protein S8 [Candidatus Saccharibacteria bacterium RIFCSPHIGHO2_12_FULL_41_12]|nr:MAG: 30S ribosomal protein S8 [Candidatus Saccharibacteria bacterium RIFCSPHIGHO2_12_FULL_41_12]
MVSTDPISDMLTRIRNAIAVSKTQVEMPYSTVKFRVAGILKDNNFLDDVSQKGEGINRKIVVTINTENSNARITEIARLSKPGRRKYVKADQVPTVKRGRGIVIVSTSKGLMTGAEAKKTNIGGELICQVY